MTSSVHLLGSGFSHAISEHMSTMADLSSAIRSDLSAGGRPPVAVKSPYYVNKTIRAIGVKPRRHSAKQTSS